MTSRHTSNHDEPKPRSRRVRSRRGAFTPAPPTRHLVTLVGLLALLAVAPAGGASPTEKSANFPARIDLLDGFFPEGIENGRGTSFFVGSMVDGAIWRGDLRTGSGAELAAGAPWRASAGIAYEARRNRIWVAGVGPPLNGSADVRVYDALSGALLATYQPTGVGLLNDVAVTKGGDLRHRLEPRAARCDPPSAGWLAPAFRRREALDGRRRLRADGGLQPERDRGRERRPARGAVCGGQALPSRSGHGQRRRDRSRRGYAHLPRPLELLGHTLYVVRPFDNRVTSLGVGLASGVVLGDLTDPSLDIPSTATVAAGRLWAVNLRFTTPPKPTTPYWITQLPLRP
jgi:hypothetical protein